VFHRSPVRAGRSRDNDIPIPDTNVPLSSGRHAEFVFDGADWWVVDRGSTNGTRLNGAPVTRARLADRDRVSLADQDLEVRVGPARRAWFGAIAVAALLAFLVWWSWPPAHGPLDAIASAARQSVFLVVIQEGDRRTVVGTAFAVEGGRLVTNAHVAAPLASLAPSGTRRPYVVSAGEREPRLIRSVTLHPGWQSGSIANDVAVLEVDGGAPAALALAGDETLHALRPNDTVAIFGFPAAFTEPERPHGSLMVNVLREVRGSRYLVVGMTVAPGTSGSPVFATDGMVIGMIAGSGRDGGADGSHSDATGPGVAVSAAVVRQALKAADR
jgi:hypothetical protein